MKRNRRRPINIDDIARSVANSPSVRAYNTQYDKLVQEELNKIESANAEYEERQKNMRDAIKQRQEELDAIEQSDRVDVFLNSKKPAEVALEFDEDAGEAWGWNKDNWQDRTKTDKHGIRFYDTPKTSKHSKIADQVDALTRILPIKWGAGSFFSSTPFVGVVGGTLLNYVFDKLRGDDDRIRNAVDYFGILKNETEIKDALGEVLKAREKQQMLSVVQLFLDNNSRLLALQDLLTSKYTSDSSQDINARFEILKDMQSLILQNTQLLPQVQSAGTYEYHDIDVPFSTLPEYMPHERRTTGRVSSTINEATKLFKETNWGDRNIKLDQLENILKNLDDFSKHKFEYDDYVDNTVVPDARLSILKDQEDLKKYYVDPVYKTRGEAAQRSMSFTDLDTYLYGLPGVLGSSASNNGIQLASQAVKFAGAGLTASGAGAEFGIPLTLVGAVLGVMSGEHENNAEVASNYQEIFLKKLERTDNYEKFIKQTSEHAGRYLNPEEAFNHFVFNPESVKDEEIKQIAAQTLLGANNLFANDMAAVTGSELIEASIGMFVPLGGKAAQAMLGRGWKSAISRSLVNFSQRHPAAGAFGKFAARSLDNVTPGTPATMILQTGKGAVGTALRTPYNLLSRELGNRIRFLSKEFIENPGSIMAIKSGLKGTANLIGAELGMGLTEAIEEGKQNLHGASFKKGEFAGDKHNLFDIVMNDIAAEARAGYSFIGNTLFGLQSDPELLAEMRGGFLAPFGSMTSIQPLVGRISNIAHEILADHLVGNNVMAMKLQDQLDIQTGIQYAKAASNPNSYNYVLNSFDKIKDGFRKALISADENGELYDGFTQEEVEQQRQRFLQIAALSLDRDVMQVAEERGIKPGTEDYFTLIALYNYGINRLSDVEPKIQEALEAIDNMINNLIVSQEELQQISIGTVGSIKDLLYSRNKESEGLSVPKQELSETDEEYYDRMNREYRELAVNFINRRRNFINLIAEIDAIMKRKELLEAIEDKTPAQQSQLDFYNLQLILAKQKISKETSNRIGLSNIGTSEELQQLVNPAYREDHNDLVQLYDRMLQEEIEFEEASNFIDELMGTSTIGFSVLNNEQIASIIKRISKESSKAKRGINKSIKSKTRKILDDYKDIVKQDKQFVQYLQDAFYEQKKALDDFDKELREEMGEKPVEKPFDLSEETKEEPQPTTEELVKPTVEPTSQPQPVQSPLVKPVVTKDPLDIEDEDVYPSVDQNERMNILEEFGAEGKRGRKLINRAKRDLNEAKTDIEQIDALSRFENSLKRGAYATDKEKKVFEDLHKKLKSDGYEIPLKVGDSYNEGMVVEVENFIPDDTLEPGKRIISGIIRPQINKNGVMVRAGKIQVRQNLSNPEDTTDPKRSAALAKLQQQNGNKPELVNITSTDPQQQTVDLLQQVIKNQEGKITKTGRDYFIVEDGKIKRIPRVHTVKEAKYDLAVTIKRAIKENYTKLSELYDSDIEEFKKEAKRLADLYNQKLAERYGKDSYMYDTYCVSVDQYLVDDIIKDRAIIDSISNIVSFGTFVRNNTTNIVLNVPSRAVIAGTIADSIERAIFSGKNLLYSKEFLMPESAFNAYVEQIKQQKEAYERDGYKIITDSIILHGKIYYRGNLVEVAGEPDMLLVAKDGSIKIVDFKTSKKSYTPTYRWTYYIDNQLLSSITKDPNKIPEDAISVSIEYDALDDGQDGSISTRQQYEEQLSMYSDLIEYMFSDQNMHILGLELLPSEVRTRAGVNKFGKIDTTILDRFVAANETTLSNDDKFLTVDYIKLRPSVKMHRIESKQISPSITEQPDTDLTTLFSLVEKINTFRNKLGSEYNVIVSNGITISQELLQEFLDSSLMLLVLKQRYESLINDVLQKSNLDTVKQLETDIQVYINKLEYFIESLLEIQSKYKPTSPQPLQIQFKPQQIEFENGIYRFIHIDQSHLDLRPYASELRRVMALPDFLETAEFELDVEGWNRPVRSSRSSAIDYIKIKYTEKTPDGKTITHVFGETGGYVPILIHLTDGDGNVIRKENNPVVQKINELLADPNNKGKRILLKPLGRTSGTVLKRSNKTNISSAFGFSDEQLSKLLEGSRDGQLGVVTGGNVGSILHNSTESSKVLHLLNSDNKLEDGVLVLEYNMQYTEDGNEPWKHSIPVPLFPKKLHETDVDFIISCLQNWHKLRTVEVNGKTVKSPLTNRQLLTLLIRFGNQSTVTKNRFVFDFAVDDQGAPNYRMIRLGGLKIGENQYSEIALYNLDIPSEVDALKEELKKLSVYHTSEYVMYQSTSVSEDGYKLTGLKKFFLENPEINQIKFSDSLVFNREDVDPNKDGSYSGITIAHWMMRHGWMTSDFNGVTNPLIAFGDAYVENVQEILDEHNEIIDEQPDESVTFENFVYDPNAEQEDEEQESNEDESGINTWLNKKQPSKAKIPLDEKLARKRLRRILGKDFNVEVIPDLIDQDERVVGRMKISSIILSTQAEFGTEFHEAFHDILEFKVGEKRRNKIYEHYRKKYGNPSMSDEEVTEHLADMYMDFRNGISIEGDHVINDTFKQLLRWVVSLFKLSDFKLARLFVETSLGLYAKGSLFYKGEKKPYTKQSIQNFINRFNKDYLNYSTTDKNGKKTKWLNFVNRQQLDDAVGGLLYMIIRGCKIDNLGTNLRQLDTSLSGVKNVLGKAYSAMVAENLTDEQISKLPLTQQRNIRMMRELFEKWDIATHQLIVDKLEAIGVNSKLKRDKQKKIELEGDNTSAVHDDIEGHSDEFWSHSRTDDVSAAVLFFLSTIPAQRYATEEDIKAGQIGTDGKVITSLFVTNKKGQKIRTKVVTKKNSLGYTSFLPFNFVYLTLLKNFYNVNSAEELYVRLKLAGQNDFMFDYIAKAFHDFRYKSYIRYSEDVYKGIPKVVVDGVLLDPTAYVKDLNDPSELELYPKHVIASQDIEINGQLIRQGERIPNAIIITNPDYESITTLIYQAIKSQRLDFTFCFLKQYVDENGAEQKGRYIYDTGSTNSEQAQRNYPHSWFNNVKSLYGDVLNGNHKNTSTTFKQVAQTLRNMRDQFALISSGRGTTVFGLNPNVLTGYDSIATIFVSCLNQIGISIDKQVLNYMLIQRYPNMSTQQAFLELITSRGVGSINSLIEEDGILDQMQKALDNENYALFIVDSSENSKKGTINSGSYLYAGNTFVKTLALWYGRYKAASQEMQALGPDNTHMYMFAQNNSASDTVDDLRRAVVDTNGKISESEQLQDLVYQNEGSTEPVYYNSYIDSTDKRIGSIIIKTLMNPNFVDHSGIWLSTHSGMKSDQRRDGGRKYVEITAREDWLSKADMLSNGYIIFPTLSDKSTWFYLHGFYLPGLRWINGKLTNHDVNQLIGVDSKNNIHINSFEQIDQLIEYAKCDLANALFVQKLLKDHAIPDEKMVKNFHTGDQHGARLAFMLGIYNEDGTYISFNNNKRTPEEDIHEAYAYFFNKSLDELRELMLRLVQKRLEKELDSLVERGIIVHNISQAAGRSTLLGYSNKYLDADKINQLKRLYAQKTNSKGKKFSEFLSDAQLESLAILTYVNDVNIRSNMSLLETQRIFTGMPHFFKWKYDDKTGELLDVREDESKRYGGLGSTGVNNRMDLPNMETEYTCAEIRDWEIASPIYHLLYPAFLDNKLKQALADKRIELLFRENPNATIEEQREIYRSVYNSELKIEDIKKELGGISKILEEQAKQESNSYQKEINVADGTAFITDKMAENLLRQRGVFTKSVQKAFSLLRRERTYDYDYLSDSDAYKIIFDALISTQKYSAFGYRKEFGIPVHFYNKFALFPIFEGISYGFTHDLYQKMNGKNGVDMVMFTSAVKAGSEGALKFEPTMSAEKIAAFSFKNHIYKQKYSFIRRQLNTDPRTDEIMSMGTQAAKVALSNIRDGQTYTLENGNIVFGDEIKFQIMQDINALADRGYESIKEQFFNEDGTLSIEKFSEFIKHELMLRNADKNLLDAVEVVYDKDSEGNNKPNTARFRADLNSVSNMSWIESIVVSHINSEVIDINLPGNAYYQRSVFGMEKTPYHMMNGEKLDDYVVNGGEELKMINEEGSMDAMVSIDYFLHIIPKELRYNPKAARLWLIDSNVIGPNAKANIMAYRIPTQAPSSIHALRIVDVISIVRDTVVLPKEFTKITGADFDIDKLYLSSLNYQIGENGLATDIFDSTDSRFIQNRLLKNYLSLLKESGKLVNEGELELGKYIHSLQRSIDNDTDLLTGKEKGREGVLTKIEANRKKEAERPLAYGSLSTQVDIKNSFITGKQGIAPFALNNNSLILTQLYKVSFAKQDGILDWLNARSLHGYSDRDGNSILSWLGALINAHVDVAKDPYILRLNVNRYTWNLLNLLVRTGFGDDAFYFINQPVLKLLAEEFDNMNGTVVDDPGMSPTQRIRENERAIIQSLYNNWGYNTSLGGILSAALQDDYELTNEHKTIFLGLFGVDKDGNYNINEHTVLEDIMTNPDALIKPEDGVTLSNLSDKPMYKIGEQTLSPRDVQAYVFLAKMHFDQYAQAMSDLVNGTKIDTKKQGINYTEQLLYDKDYLALRENEMFDEHLLDLLDKSFIDNKTQKALELLPAILGLLMIHYSRPFLNSVTLILERLNKRSNDTRKAVHKALLSYIKQKAMNACMAELGVDFKSMVTGSNTMASRLSKIRSKMLQNPDEFVDFVSNGDFTNNLLSNLSLIPHVTPFGSQQYDIIGLDNSEAVEVEVKDGYIDDWMLLYESSDEEVSTFARDLAIYAFMTSADNPGFTTFFKYVPLLIREDIGYTEKIRQLADAFKYNTIDIVDSPEEDMSDSMFTINIRDVIRNNWRNPNIVPLWNRKKWSITERGKSSFDRIRTFIPLDYSDMGVDEEGNPIVVTKNTPKMFIASVSKSKRTGEYPLFLKLPREGASRYDSNRYILYELITVAQFTPKNSTITREYPLYGITRQPGFEIHAGSSTYTFYENGRNDHYQLIFDEEFLGNREQWFSEQVTRLQEYMQNHIRSDYRYKLSEYLESGIEPFEGGEYSKDLADEIKMIRDAAISTKKPVDIPQDVNDLSDESTQSSEADQFDQFVRDNSNWNDPDEFSDEEMKHCKH